MKLQLKHFTFTRSLILPSVVTLIWFFSGLLTFIPSFGKFLNSNLGNDIILGILAVLTLLIIGLAISLALHRQYKILLGLILGIGLAIILFFFFILVTLGMGDLIPLATVFTILVTIFVTLYMKN